jgi:hypothetical protein
VNRTASRTRSRKGTDTHALGVELDPYACGDCLVIGDACEFHAGFAAGWDTCMEHVSRWVLGND